MKPLEYVTNNEKEVLAFLRTQYPLYHLSNVFFRDVQYGIQTMFERRGEKVGYQDAEKVAHAFVEKLVNQKIFTPIDRQSWVLNYPEYKTVATKPSAPAKPAPGAAPVKSPAASRPPLPPLGGAKPAGAFPPLTSGKPAGGAKPVLPPLTSAKPAGGIAKPSLPPLANGVPAGDAKATLPPRTSEKEENTEQVESSESKAPAETKTVEAPKLAASDTPGSASSGTPPPPGQRKPLPPLRGNYTPAGKK